jgi:HPt (histidine-containing phosphotransfer) domain-containing protein
MDNFASFISEQRTNNEGMISHSYLNLSYIRNLSGGNNQFVVRMLQTFCKNVPPGIDQLMIAGETGNLQEIKQLAHKLKTMFRYVGVDQVAEYLERLEFRSLELTKTERANLLSQIDAASKRAVIEAQEVILTTPV